MSGAGQGRLSPADHRVGIFGGTFDPVHYGHLGVAEQVAEALALDRVVFIPAGQPPHKPGKVISPAADRLAMLRLAIAGNDRFALSTMELERSGPSYSVDTIQELVGEAEAQRVERDLFFIMSSEALAGLPSWRDPWRLLSLCRIAVVPRMGAAFPDRAWLEARFPGRSSRVECIETTILSYSASEIRARVTAGRSIRYLVPPAVESYVREHRLYRSDITRNMA